MSLFMDDKKVRDILDFGDGTSGGGGGGTTTNGGNGNGSGSGSNRRNNSNSATDNDADSFVRGSGGSGDDDKEDEIPWHAAPPNDYIDNIKGYELTSFDAVNVPPPPDEVDLAAIGLSVAGATAKEGAKETEDKEGAKEEPKDPPAPPPPPISLTCEVQLTEEEARKALLVYLSDHCCYGKGAARGMVVKKVELMPAYHYELQTFSERRETAWTYSSVKSGGYGDLLGFGSGGGGGYGGTPPLPWEIEEFPSQPFKDEVRMVPVPNTSNVKSCHRCRGTGGVLCKDCNGKGWFRCMHCHGDGWLGEGGGSRERCFYCQHSKHGHGQQDCSKCGTKGKVSCATCDGQGQVRCYIQLSITWKVHTAEHIVDRFGLPRELIRDVSGQVAFEEEMSRLKPLRVSDQDISDASVKLVSNHASAFADQRIVAQRHQVRVVPVSQVTYEWKGKQHSFFVYGYENKVHLKKYPQDCCWGCQLM